jgi:hypothetical protein
VLDYDVLVKLDELDYVTELEDADYILLDVACLACSELDISRSRAMKDN